MRLRVSHVTAYSYEGPVSVSHDEARVTPRATPSQRVERTQILVEPTPTVLATHTDYFGNVVHFFTVEESHETLTVTSVSDVEVTRAAPPPPALTPEWERVRDLVRADSSRDGLRALDLLLDSPHAPGSPELADYAAVSFPSGRPVLEGAVDLMRRIHSEFSYEQGVTSIATAPAEVLASRRGVCQDFAHLELAMLRSLGIPARYVSGVIRTQPPPGRPRLVGADATHAWLAVYCPGFGYVDLDPTNGTIPGEDHVTVAWGRDFGDVSPLRGVILGGGPHQLTVSVDVAPISGTTPEAGPPSPEPIR